MYSTKSSLLNIFLLVLILLLVNNYAFSQTERFQEASIGLKFDYPSHFENISKKPSPEILVLLRNKSVDGLPTLNVIKQPGDAQIAQKTPYQLGLDVVDSYRAIGLYDAEVKKTEKRNHKDREIFYAEIFYPMGGKPTMAGVYIFPAKDYYLVFTFVENPDNYQFSKDKFDQIISTVSLRDPPPIYQEVKESKVVFWWLIGIVSVLILAFFFSFFRK